MSSSPPRVLRLYDLVYPRNTAMVRFVIVEMNLILRLKRKPVRAAICPADEIERVARGNGLVPHASQDVGLAWQVVVYRPDADRLERLVSRLCDALPASPIGSSAS